MICKRDSLLYLPSNNINIVNVANPFQPVLAGTYSSYNIKAVDVVGNYAYLFNHDSLDVLDVSVPASPVRTGRLALQHQNTDTPSLAVSGDYAYVDEGADIEIDNISDPAHPVYAGNIPLEFGGAYRISIHNNLLVVPEGMLAVYDISNPTAPTQLARYTEISPNVWFWAAAADDQYVYGGTPDTFYVFQIPTNNIRNDGDINLPHANFLLQNYPNPFNAQTTISYNLSQAGLVTLSIYNIMGQKVATLVDGAQDAGEHKAIWDAGDVPSGVYFYRLKAGATSKIEKCVLLK